MVLLNVFLGINILTKIHMVGKSFRLPFFSANYNFTLTPTLSTILKLSPLIILYLPSFLYAPQNIPVLCVKQLQLKRTAIAKETLHTLSLMGLIPPSFTISEGISVLSVAKCFRKEIPLQCPAEGFQNIQFCVL